MNPPPETALDGDMQAVLAIGVVLFAIGLVLCLRGTRFGNQLILPLYYYWPTLRSYLRGELPLPGVKSHFDGSRMIGIALLAIGYLLVGIVLLFVAPGWGALAFAMGFAAVVAVALARSR